MGNPKVSIIVPIYGVEKYLNQCVDSILAQTLEDIEIILVNDGSKDRCPQIIDDYASKDERIVVLHQPNGGYGHAMNQGLSVATGEYVGIVEPDDYIDPNMYEELYQSARANDTDITKSSFYNLFEFSGLEEKARWDRKLIPSGVFTAHECGYFLYTHPSIWSCIYRRSFLEENHIRFVEPKGAGWADNPFQVQTICLAQRINFLNTPFYHYRKFNYSESDDLKDYRIPFDRTSEIHNWLESHHISDGSILENLYRRELTYIQIVLGKEDIDDKRDCYLRIQEMAHRWDMELVLHSTAITKYEKKIMRTLQDSVEKSLKIIKLPYKKSFARTVEYNHGVKTTLLWGGIVRKEKSPTSKKLYLFGIPIYHKKR
jgi:glycosyltransferase involved in cell wall biosynthesis